MIRKDSKIRSLSELRKVPIAVTWHAGTFYAAIEVLEAAGVPFEDITLVHANDRLEALLNGTTDAAALIEPLVSRAAAAGARNMPTCAGAAASSRATTSTTKPRRNCAARSTTRSIGCAGTRTANANSCCAILRPNSAEAG